MFARPQHKLTSDLPCSVPNSINPRCNDCNSHYSQIKLTINSCKNSIIRFGLWNARSICNKLNFFQSLAYSKSFDIICITETWLTSSILNKEILPENYTIYRRDRGSRGGGILIGISDNIPSKLAFTSPSAEVTAVELLLHPPLLLYCVYDPPSSPYSLSHNQNLFHSLSSIPHDSNCLVVGDFNAPDISWSSMTATNTSSIQLCNLCYEKISFNWFKILLTDKGISSTLSSPIVLTGFLM